MNRFFRPSSATGWIPIGAPPTICRSARFIFTTIRQQKKDGTPFIKAIIDAGIIPFIKVDTGAIDMAGHPGEKATEGLDGLRGRLAAYSQLGARFARLRAVIALGDSIPGRGCIEANAQVLAAQQALYHRAWCNQAARRGEYNTETERT
jgi:fructose-bisphosphate aldolase class 1